MVKYIKTALLISTLIFTQSCTYNVKAQYSSEKSGYIYKFPNDFMWGTSTAAYQIEGNITNDWSSDGLDAGNAADGYQRYTEDAKYSKQLGNNAYRFSIEWARIEPEQGKFDLKEVEHYRKVLLELKRNGIKPIVTLHHFTNPVWIAKIGGWENSKTIDAFKNFVGFIASQFQDLVDYWITVNEPNVYAFKAYDSGVFPPYKKDRKAAIRVMANLIKAHAEAYRIIHNVDKTDADGDGKSAMVSFAHHIAVFEPHNPINPLDQIYTYFEDRIFNKGFWEIIDTGEIHLNIPGAEGVNEPFNPIIKDSLDFIGLNYYTRWYIYGNGEQKVDDKAEQTDSKWEIYPDGLLNVLQTANHYAKRRNLPIIITENGIDDGRDHKRTKYIVTHTKKVWDAIQQGIPVKGYFYWSLMDNFEWADKFKPKYGLYTIDRKMRKSAQIYSQICNDNGVPKYLVDKYQK